MAERSKIQWTDATWNVARGCTKVDEDCKFCYMYRDSMNGTRYEPKQVIRTKTVFNFPLRYKETKSGMWEGRPLIFTSSLTDVFHESIDPYRNEIWDIIRKCPHLIFQILTKRPERIKDHLPEDWGEGWDNVWLGTSVGSQPSIQRARDLSKVKSKVLFLSLEPLHGEVSFENIYTEGWIPSYNNPDNIGCDQIAEPLLMQFDWVIVGGESGNDKGLYRYRPCKLKWINSIVSECKSMNVPVFVKQLGTHLSKELKLSDRPGGNMDEWPEYLRVRQFPKV